MHDAFAEMLVATMKSAPKSKVVIQPAVKTAARTSAKLPASKAALNTKPGPAQKAEHAGKKVAVKKVAAKKVIAKTAKTAKAEAQKPVTTKVSASLSQVAGTLPTAAVATADQADAKASAKTAVKTAASKPVAQSAAVEKKKRLVVPEIS